MFFHCRGSHRSNGVCTVIILFPLSITVHVSCIHIGDMINDGYTIIMDAAHHFQDWHMMASWLMS